MIDDKETKGFRILFLLKNKKTANIEKNSWIACGRERTVAPTGVNFNFHFFERIFFEYSGFSSSQKTTPQVDVDEMDNKSHLVNSR